MSSLSPTQRTLQAMRAHGRVCGIVEKFNHHVGPFGIRQDLFGFIDIIAIDPVQGIVAVQSCGQDFAGHVAKMLGERNDAMFEWIKHAPIELWGWRKVKLKRGGAAMRWRPRVADVRLSPAGDLTMEERK